MTPTSPAVRAFRVGIGRVHKSECGYFRVRLRQTGDLIPLSGTEHIAGLIPPAVAPETTLTPSTDVTASKRSPRRLRISIA